MADEISGEGYRAAWIKEKIESISTPEPALLQMDDLVELVFNAWGTLRQHASQISNLESEAPQPQQQAPAAVYGCNCDGIYDEIDRLGDWVERELDTIYGHINDLYAEIDRLRGY